MKKTILLLIALVLVAVLSFNVLADDFTVSFEESKETLSQCTIALDMEHCFLVDENCNVLGKTFSEGETVTFNVMINPGYSSTSTGVWINGKFTEPVNGKYTFVIEEDTVIKAELNYSGSGSDLPSSENFRTVIFVACIVVLIGVVVAIIILNKKEKIKGGKRK